TRQASGTSCARAWAGVGSARHVELHSATTKPSTSGSRNAGRSLKKARRQNAPAGQPRAAPRRKQAACHTAHAVCALLSFGSPTTVGHEGELQREGTRP